MKELGKESEKYHREIFNLINNSDIEKCLFICDKENEKIYTNYLCLLAWFLRSLMNYL